MKTKMHIQTATKFLAAIAFTVLAASCASELQEKENLAVAAGFKVITPVKPDQIALLPTLPKDKVTQVNYGGKTYYVLPDLKNNQAYVGGPAEYQAYRQLRLAKQISDDNLAAAQMNQAAAMNWGAWGGWGAPGWGGMGYGYRR
jgi:hypothetical protein